MKYDWTSPCLGTITFSEDADPDAARQFADLLERRVAEAKERLRLATAGLISLIPDDEERR